VLTGSSNFLTVPTISESLAGRAGLVEVWPFTRGEISGKPDRFVEHALAGPAAFGAYEPGRFSRPDLLARVCTVKCKFMTGIALYAGNDVLPFGDRLIAAPISSLCGTCEKSLSTRLGRMAPGTFRRFWYCLGGSLAGSPQAGVQ